MKTEKTIYNNCVTYFLEFYLNSYGVAYNFTGADGKLLKGILKHLQALSENKGYIWDESGALNAWNIFLVAACSDQWIKERLDLRILSAQLNRIILMARTIIKNQKDMENLFKEMLKKELLLWVERYSEQATCREDLFGIIRKNFNYKGYFWRKVVDSFNWEAKKKGIEFPAGEQHKVYTPSFWGDLLADVPALLGDSYLPLL